MPVFTLKLKQNNISREINMYKGAQQQPACKRQYSAVSSLVEHTTHTKKVQMDQIMKKIGGLG